ncbi:MAG TPA: type II secretion system F family protein [Firmicutes bacterium]|nr:type II secretion system F family protein [Bacillota bacterium]
MPEFRYQGRDKEGKTVSGVLEGASEAVVAQRLRDMGYYVTELEAARGGLPFSWSAVSGRGGKGGRVGLKDLALFTRQLAVILKSGLTLANALAALEGQTENARLRAVIASLRSDVEAGTSFADALRSQAAIFRPIYVNSVMAGEAGGNLDTVLARLASSLERDLELTQKVKSAMYYPIAVACIAILLIGGMLVFVLPTFTSMFADSGMQLPLPTRIIMGLSLAVRRYGLFILLALVAGIWGAVRLLQRPDVRREWDQLQPQLPVVGRLVRQIIVARFSRTFATLLGAGVPLLESLRISAEVVGNAVVQEQIAGVADGVRQGENLAAPLGRIKVFPPLLSQMVAIGEEAGTVEVMLTRIADMYDTEVDQTVRGLTSLVEPLIILVLGGGIGFIVASVFLPLVGMVQAVGG